MRRWEGGREMEKSGEEREERDQHVYKQRDRLKLKKYVKERGRSTEHSRVQM